jgi:hypothetical protein
VARRTSVTATFYDAEGYAFVSFRGNPQDVADASSIYALNLANPLGGTCENIEFVTKREEE